MNQINPTDYVLSIKALFSNKTESETEEFRRIFGIKQNDFALNNEDLISIAKKIFKEYEIAVEAKGLVEKFVKFEEKDFCHQLIEQYRPLIPSPYLQFIDSPDVVDYGLVHDDRPYCSITNLGEGQYAIIMSQGLQRVLYSALRSFCSFINIGEDDKSSISLDELGSILADDFFIFGNTFMIFPRQNVQISSNQIILANRIMIYSELFFLLHEFSHILITNSLENEIISTREDEYLADYYAMISCLNMSDSVAEKELIFLACVFGLLVFATLERLQVYPTDSAYPSFKERIVNIKTVLNQICGSESLYNSIANSANIAESIFEQINNIQGSEQEKIYREKTNTYIESYLSSNCNFTSDMSYVVPDYEMFKSEMWQLLMDGHYETIYHSLLFFAKQSLRDINEISTKFDEDANEITAENKSKYTMSQNRFKLIYHFTHTLPDPIAHIFIDICDLAKQ